MPTKSASYSFTILGNPACWEGPASRFEGRLRSPLPDYALEALRTRLLYAVTTTHDPAQGARRILQMAFETEIGAAIAKMVIAPLDLTATVVCPARRYLEIDADMATYSFLFNPALKAVRALGFLPESYVALFEKHLGTSYAKYRVCAMAALLCICAQYLIPDVGLNLVLTAADAVTAADAAKAERGRYRSATDTATTADTHALVPSVNEHDAVTATDTVTIVVA